MHTILESCYQVVLCYKAEGRRILVETVLLRANGPPSGMPPSGVPKWLRLWITPQDLLYQSILVDNYEVLPLTRLASKFPELAHQFSALLIKLLFIWQFRC